MGRGRPDCLPRRSVGQHWLFGSSAAACSVLVIPEDVAHARSKCMFGSLQVTSTDLKARLQAEQVRLHHSRGRELRLLRDRPGVSCSGITYTPAVACVVNAGLKLLRLLCKVLRGP